MIESTRILDRPIAASVEQQAAKAGFTPLQARVIAGRLSDQEASYVERLVRPRMERLYPPDALPDIDAGTDAVARAITDGLPILIISDFDCDGASGHSVVRLALRDYFGVPESRLFSYIGHRLRDGYGVSETLTNRILAEAPTPAVAITVDQGSTDHLRIAKLHRHGITTVITDHHGVPEGGPPPDAVACINPARRDSKFGDPYVAGVHVAWLLCCAVRQRLIALGQLARTAPRLGALLDLVALGTMADCVDLARSLNNRLVLTRGLRLMNQQDARPVWAALHAATRGASAISGSTLAFSFGPVINARGRLDCALGSVDLLMCTQAGRARDMARALVAHNLERKRIQQDMIARATAWAQQQVQRGAAAIAIHDPDGHPGVQGICAARLVEMTGRPVAYLSPKHGGTLLTGSLRSIPGLHVREALSDIAAELGEAMPGWGGHAGAGGVSLAPDTFERFAQAWNSLVAERMPLASLGPRVWTDGELPVEPGFAVLRELAELEPFGRQWERPVFRAEAVVESLRPVGDGTHLKLSLRMGNRLHDAIWFSALRGSVSPIQQGQTVSVAFELDTNTFRAETRLQMRVRHACARSG